MDEQAYAVHGFPMFDLFGPVALSMRLSLKKAMERYGEAGFSDSLLIPQM